MKRKPPANTRILAPSVALLGALCALWGWAGCERDRRAHRAGQESTEGILDIEGIPDPSAEHPSASEDDDASSSELPVSEEDESEDPGCAPCDDGNPCTREVCAGAQCTHVPDADHALGCKDDQTLRLCDGGQPAELPCPLGCLQSGYNAFGGCDADRVGCLCGRVFFPECEPGAIACVADLYIGECESGEANGVSHNMWRAYPCDDVCAEAGYGPATACGIDYQTFEFACYCSDVCDPPCPQGYTCWNDACWPDDDSTDPSDDECWTDADCGWRQVCSSTGRCQDVECDDDGDCGWCELCHAHYCYGCGLDEDGDCTCY